MQDPDEFQHYTSPIVPLILGLDPSHMKLGFAFTELLTGKPKWCGVLPIYEVDMGWREHQMRDKMLAIFNTLVRKSEAHYPVSLVVIERMFVGPNPKTAVELSEIAGTAGGISKMLWPDALIDHFTPAEWRKANGLSGRATKEEVYDHARQSGFDPPPLCGKCPKCKDGCGQDAADAALIGRAGYHSATKSGDRPSALALVGVQGDLARDS